MCEDVQLLPCPSEEAEFRVPIAGSPIALAFASGAGADAGVSAGVDRIGLGGWGIDVVHHFDTARGLLVLGDGRRRHVQPITTHVGTDDVLVVAADDVPELYVFDATGLHLRTLDSITGTLIRRMVWSPDGIAAVVDADEVATTVERDETGAAIAIHSPQGSESRLGTSDGRLAAVVDPLGARWDMRYDTAGRLSVVRDPVGGQTEFGYDAEGRLARRADPSGASLNVERTQTPAGFALSWRTNLGKTAHASVDAGPDGSMVRTFTDAAGLKSELTVDGTSRTLRTPDGSTTSIRLEPDARWQMQAPLIAEQNTTSPAGRVRAITHARTVAGNPSVLGPWATEDRMTLDGATWTLAVDPASRRATMTDPLGANKVWVTDERGHVVAIERSGLATIAYSYDARGRVVTIMEDPAGEARTWRYVYDDQAGSITVTDPVGHTNVARTDQAGRTTDLTLAGDRTMTTAWDPMGRLNSVTPPGRQAHVSQLRADGQRDATYRPNGETAVSMTGFDYDLDAALSTVTWSDGTANLGRDASGRLTSRADASGESLFGYDSAGLPATFERSDVVEQIGYDGPAPVSLAWTGLVSGTIDREVDGQGRVISESLSGGPAIDFQYDQAGRLAVAGDLTLQRDSQTGLVSQESLGALTTVRHYDNRGLLIGLEITDGTSTIYQLDVSRDGLGRVSERAEGIAGQTITSTYNRDQAGRLAGVAIDGSPTATYTYDANGNLTVATGDAAAAAAYDAGDALVRRGDVAYTYDGRGRLSTLSGPDGITRFGYDVTGGLASVARPDGTTVEYGVDALGRRVTKSIDGGLVSGWLYGDGQRVIAELDATGNVVSRFVYGDTGTAPAYVVKDGRTYQLVTDDLGSVRLVVDASSGEIAQRLDYDAWGVVLADSAPGFQPFGFAGGMYDADTGLVRFGARDYDAQAGRWTAPDPIGFAGGDPNLYAYAFNDPVSLSDPTGLCTVETAGYALSGYFGIGGTIGGGLAYANGEYHPYLTAGYGGGSPSFGPEVTYGCTVDGEGDPFDLARGWNNGWTWGMGPFSNGQDYSIPNRVGTTGDATSHGWHASLGPEVDPPHFEFETTKTWVWGCWFGCSHPPPADSGKPDRNRGDETAGVCSGEATSCSDALGDAMDKYNNQSLAPCDADCGSSWGDPHLVTLDGLKYDFQAAGEFVLVHSQTDDLEIQVRQETYGAISSIAFDTAVAMDVNGDRVGFYGGGQHPLLVNGVVKSLDLSLDLPHGGRIETLPAGLVITWVDGSRVVLAGGPGSIFVDLVEAWAGNVTGLLGNFDGDPGNDLTSRDGTLVEAAKADFNHPMYTVFGNSWRVDQAASLFDDLPGQDVVRYEQLEVPSAAATTDGLTADTRAAAEAACRSLGITDPDVLEGCILDLGTTGDMAFALSAQQADAALTRPSEPVASDQIEVTVTVNGQPATTGGRLEIQAFTQTDPPELVATSFENPGVLAVPTGTYDVFVLYRSAWQQMNVSGTIETWLRGVSAGNGSDASRSLDLELGSATVHVTEATGKPLDLSVFGMSIRSLDDERVQDLYALQTNPATFDLPAGSYEVTVDYASTSLHNDGPVGTFTVVAGQATTEDIDLQLGRLQVRVVDATGAVVPADQLLVMTIARSDSPDHAFAQAYGANPGDLIVPGNTPFDLVVTLDGDRRGWVAHRDGQQVGPGQSLTLDIPITEFGAPG